MIVNRSGGGGGSGGKLTVNAPAGVTVTATKDRVITRTANAEGVAVFKGLSSGTWWLSIDDDTHEPSTPVSVEITVDYNKTLAFFAAYINITYPAGSICTATDGVSTFTAPNTSGTWALTVLNKGTWTISNGEVSENVEITADGQTVSVELSSQTFIYYYQTGVTGVEAGSWDGLNIRSDDGWSNGSLSTTNKALNITVNNSSYGVGATKKLDLTFISELRIVATATGFGGGDYDQAVVWISSVRSTATDTNYVIKQELITGTNIIDVSSLSGSYYLVIDAASDYSRTLVASEIYGVAN